MMKAIDQKTGPDSLPVSAAEAKVVGSKKYFTGRPCSRGHVAYRYTATGTCSACAIEQAKARNDANPDRRREVEAKYRERNRQALRQRQVGWRANYPERNRAATAKWYAENSERHLDRQAERRKENPEPFRHQWRVYRARKIKAEGTHTVDDVHAIHASQGFVCAACFTDTTDAYHVDHIVALSRGGTNWPSNLQVLCRSCNQIKNAKDDAEAKAKIRLKLGITLPPHFKEFSELRSF